MSDKPFSEYEMALQEFVISAFKRTKIAFMIYSISRRRGEGLGYSKIFFSSRSETLIKPIEPTSSSSAQKGLYSYFVPEANKEEVLNQRVQNQKF